MVRLNPIDSFVGSFYWWRVVGKTSGSQVTLNGIVIPIDSFTGWPCPNNRPFSRIDTFNCNVELGDDLCEKWPGCVAPAPSVINNTVGGNDEFITKPLTSDWAIQPDPRNEEFEGLVNVMPPAGWTVFGNYSGTSSDPYATFADANTFRGNVNALRKSWIIIQPSADNHGTGIYKPVAIGTNELIWTRIRTDNRAPAPDGTPAIFLMLANGPFPTKTAHVFISLSANIVGWAYAIGWGTEVSGSNISIIGKGTTQVLPGIEYLAIQKLGTNYHLWCSDGAKGWFYVTKITNANVMTHVGLQWTNGLNPPQPGNPFVGCDFIRFSATSNVLP